MQFLVIQPTGCKKVLINSITIIVSICKVYRLIPCYTIMYSMAHRSANLFIVENTGLEIKFILNVLIFCQWTDFWNALTKISFNSQKNPFSAPHLTKFCLTENIEFYTRESKCI